MGSGLRIGNGFRYGSKPSSMTASKFRALYSASKTGAGIKTGSYYGLNFRTVSGTSIVRTGLIINAKKPGYYTYGAYSGNRFGYSIRRNYYWPILFIHFGHPYRFYHHDRHHYSKRANTTTPSNVVISDRYFKISKTLLYLQNALFFALI